MYVRLATTRTVGQILFVFGIQEFSIIGPVPRGYERSTYMEQGSLIWTPKLEINILSETALTILIKFQ
jgi:hypothetical protein